MILIISVSCKEGKGVSSEQQKEKEHEVPTISSTRNVQDIDEEKEI